MPQPTPTSLASTIQRPFIYCNFKYSLMFSHNRKQQVMYGLYVAWSIKEVNRTSLGSKGSVIYG